MSRPSATTRRARSMIGAPFGRSVGVRCFGAALGHAPRDRRRRRSHFRVSSPPIIFLMPSPPCSCGCRSQTAASLHGGVDMCPGVGIAPADSGAARALRSGLRESRSRSGARRATIVGHDALVDHPLRPLASVRTPSTARGAPRCSSPGPVSTSRRPTGLRQEPSSTAPSNRGSTTSTQRSSTGPTSPTSSSATRCTRTGVVPGVEGRRRSRRPGSVVHPRRRCAAASSKPPARRQGQSDRAQQRDRRRDRAGS
jgi:hypothetical protein